MMLKDTVLNDPLLKALLEQIEDKAEREKTERAINELLEHLQTKTIHLFKTPEKG